MSKKQEIEETLNLLNEASRRIDFRAQRDFILLLGDTGSGKTTLTQYIAGDNNKLESKETRQGSGEFHIKDTNDKISNSTILSKTIFPELVIDEDRNVSFYDCPGFNDTRKSSIDIANAFLIKRVIDESNNIKILLTIDYHAVREYGDRHGFINLMKHATSFIKNIDKFSKSIALVVTKVEVSYSIVDNIPVPQENEIIFENIACFLRNVKINLENEDKILYSNIIKLINIFLLKEDEVKYTRISIFKRPNKAGTIKEIESLEDCKEDIKEVIYNNIQYSPKTDQDFGFTISAESKMFIIELVEQINDLVTDNIQSICKNIEENLNVEQQQCHNLVSIEKRLNNSFYSLKELIDSLNRPTTINELYNGITYFIHKQNFKIKQQFLSNILEYQKIFNFAHVVSKQKINYRPMDWIEPLETLLKSFRIFSKWYKLLSCLYDKLSDYDVRQSIKKDEVIKSKNLFLESLNQNQSITENDLTPLLNSIKLNNELENIKNIKLDKTKMKYLAKIVETTLEQTFTISSPKKGVLEVKGNFVNISDISDEYLKDIKFLNIFALNTVYIDKDITCIGQQLQVSIIAYKWKIVGERKINLDGKPGDQQSDASTGNNGQPGLPGGNAGNFLGIGKNFVNIQNLVISANGGIGGTGQNGGVGLPGTDGVNAHVPSYVDNTDSTGEVVLSDSTKNRFVFEKIAIDNLEVGSELHKVITNISINNTEDEFDHFYSICGLSGEQGHQGGNGGAAGDGGYEGSICTIGYEINSQNFKITNQPGNIGQGGIGGAGGSGSRDGKKILGRYLYRLNTTRVKIIPFLLNVEIPFLRRETGQWFEVSKYSGNIHPSGDKGVDNCNETGKILPKKDNTQNFAYSLNRFKKFLKENLIENIDQILLLEFLNLINNDQRTSKFYNTMTIIEEMQDLEKQRHEFKDGIDFIPSYRSLLEKIIEYANTINIQKDNNFLEEKKVLAFLYAAVLSAICRLNQSSESDLIIDLKTFLITTKNYVEEIKKIRNQEKIKDFYQNYNDDLETKIEETNILIATKIIPEIDNVIKRVDNKLLDLVSEIEKIKKRTQYDKKEIESLQEKLREQIETRKILGLLKVASQFLIFAGPYGAQTSYYAAAGLKIYENIALGPAISTAGIQTNPIPPGAINTIEKIEEQIMKELVVFDFQLTHILEHLKKSSDETLQNLREKISDLQKNMKIVFDKNLGTIYTGIDKFRNILKAFKTSLDTKEQDILMTTIINIEKILSISELSLDIYSKIRKEEGKVDELSALIIVQNDKLRQLKNYERCIFEILVPVFKNVQENIKEYQKNLGSQSHAVLDVAKWEIQKSLSNLKQLMLDITNGFTIKNDLAHSIEKLMEGMSMLIDLYNHIENYHDQQKFAKYIANIASVDSSQMNLQNSELNHAIAVLDKIIKYNILLDQYERALNSFKQYIFPFANFHLEEFYISWSKNDKIISLVEKAAENLGRLQAKFRELQASISKQDGIISSGRFNNSKESFEAFYEWKNSTHHDLISDLLEEKEVIFVADILKSMNKNAIKFNIVQLEFKVSNESLQQELNEALKEYEIRMIHMGRSNYRYGKKFYFITHDKQMIQYSYSENNGEPATRNMVYDKIKKGNLVLSPYTMWSIKLIKRHTIDEKHLQTNKPRSSSGIIKKLSLFKNHIDLYLVGQGQCIKKDIEEKDNNLEKYYKLYK